jgi:20S proteasome alpha/beta subunit
VTICIAAVCVQETSPVIVCCTDLQGTYGDYIKAENEWKMRDVGNATILTAGDPSHAREVIAALTPAIRQYDEEAKDIDNFDIRISGLLEKFRRVLRERKKLLIDHYLYTRHLMTSDEYKQLELAKWVDVQKEISNISLGCELIFAYNRDYEPVLIQISDDCEARWLENYVCIGHGSYIALAVMCQENYSPLMLVMDCVAKVMFAKRATEKDPTVGTGTAMQIKTRTADRMLSTDGWDYVAPLIQPIHSPKGLQYDDKYFR